MLSDMYIYIYTYDLLKRCKSFMTDASLHEKQHLLDPIRRSLLDYWDLVNVSVQDQQVLSLAREPSQAQRERCDGGPSANGWVLDVVGCCHLFGLPVSSYNLETRPTLEDHVTRVNKIHVYLINDTT